MRRTLWAEKLSDDMLKQMIEDLCIFEEIGSTNQEYLRRIADTWYGSNTGIERLMLMAHDCYKEAAFRWMMNR